VERFAGLSVSRQGNFRAVAALFFGIIETASLGSYRISLRPAISWTRKDKITQSYWALSSLDPAAANVRHGVFKASDEIDVPYRLWLAPKPRGAILLLHGCCDYSGAFDDIAPKLVKRGFSCMAYDQRGFGATDSRGSWTSKERMVCDARDAIGFFRSRLDRLLPLFIIGESMGGSVAVHTAATQSGLDIAGIVLVAPGALASAIRNKLYNWIMRSIRLFAGQSEIVIERNDASELSASAAIRLLGDPMVMQSVHADLLAGVFGMGYDAVLAAKQVDVPALTIVAGRDDLLSNACVRQLHENLRGDKMLVELKNGPHLLLHWRHGRVVLRSVRRWIERHLAPNKSESQRDTIVAPV
jgi:alpha-beta hydrolase superfamily lysophospholipase